MGFLREYWQYLKANLWYWAVPTIVVVLIVAGLVAFAAGKATAPFRYTLF